MREGYEIYEAYIDGHEKEIDESKEFAVEITTLDTWERKWVKARIARSPEELPGGEQLWVRVYRDDKVKGPWAIKVIEELDEDEVKPVRGDVARGDKPKMDAIY